LMIRRCIKSNANTTSCPHQQSFARSGGLAGRAFYILSFKTMNINVLYFSIPKRAATFDSG